MRAGSVAQGSVSAIFQHDGKWYPTTHTTLAITTTGGVDLGIARLIRETDGWHAFRGR